MTPLQQAAKNIILRWDSPLWKDVAPTAEYVNELRKALDAELQQAVEPMFWVRMVGSDGGYEGPIHNAGIERVRKLSGAWAPLYLHPPQPQATTPVSDGLIEILREASLFIEAVEYVNELRKALDAELQQAVEPVAWLRTTETTKDSIWGTYGPNKVFETDTPLYLHPPQQQATEHLSKAFDAAVNEFGAANLAKAISAPEDQRAELIAGIKHELAEFAHNKTLETLLLDAVELLEADDAFRPDWVNYRQGVKDGKAEAQQAKPAHFDEEHPAALAVRADNWGQP